MYDRIYPFQYIFIGAMQAMELAGLTLLGMLLGTLPLLHHFHITFS